MIETSVESKKILVTGGAGYVGSTFIRDALAANYKIRCLDLLIYGGKSLKGYINHPNFEFIRGDIRDVALLERALQDVDKVVHLAAIVGDKQCKAAPKSAVEINFVGTRILAENIAKGIVSSDKAVAVKLFNSAKSDKNDVITEIFKSKAILLGSPTINRGILTSTAGLLEEIKGLGFKNKK